MTTYRQLLQDNDTYARAVIDQMAAAGLIRKDPDNGDQGYMRRDGIPAAVVLLGLVTENLFSLGEDIIASFAAIVADNLLDFNAESVPL